MRKRVFEDPVIGQAKKWIFRYRHPELSSFPERTEEFLFPRVPSGLSIAASGTGDRNGPPTLLVGDKADTAAIIHQLTDHVAVDQVGLCPGR